MEYSDDLINKTIGRLIKVYRENFLKTTRQEKYKQKNFMLEDKIPFCSERTYRDMEGGKPIRDEYIYEHFTKKLGFEYAKSRKLFNSMEAIEKEVVEAVNFYYENKCLEIERKIDVVFVGYENVIFYQEYKYLLLFLVRGIARDFSAFENIKFNVLNVIALLNDDLYIAFKTTQLMYEWQLNNSLLKKALPSFEELMAVEHKSSYTYYSLAAVLMLSGEVIRPMNLYYQGLAKANRENNKIYQVLLEVMLGSIGMSCLDSKAVEHFDKAESVIADNYELFTSRVLRIVYSNIAASYLEGLKYLEAAKYYELASNMRGSVQPIEADIALVTCYEKIGEVEKMLDLLKRISDHSTDFSGNSKMLIRFYEYKYLKDNKKEFYDFIVYSLDSMPKRSFHRNLFMDELKILATDLRLYSKFAELYKNPSEV